MFYNESYVYEVWSSIERDPNAGAEGGGITVSNASKDVAELICDVGSVYSNFAGLSDAMYARGLCWDRTTEQWLAGGCN